MHKFRPLLILAALSTLAAPLAPLAAETVETKASAPSTQLEPARALLTQPDRWMTLSTSRQVAARLELGRQLRAGDEAAEGVADPCLGHTPDQVVFYELTRKFVETEEDVPQEACDVLYYTLAVGHHTGVLDCFEPRLSVPVDVFYSLVDALPEGEAKTKFEAIRSFGECQLDKAAVPSLLEACDTLLDERGFRGSAKAGISVFDDDFGLHAQQVAFLMKFRDLVERVRDVSGVYLTGRLQ